MRQHLESCLPMEGCGLLAGLDGIARLVLPVRNGASSPVRFRMDPQEQVRAFERIEAEGLELLGIFHSHPAGPEGPSATDTAEAAYEVVHVIWSHATGAWQVNGYWIHNGRVSEVKLEPAGSGLPSTRSA